MSIRPASDIKQSFDGASGAFYITDTKSKVLYVNRIVEKESGYGVAEVVGKRPGDLWGRQMDPVFYRSMWRHIMRDKVPFYADVVNKKKNGASFSKRLRIFPVLDDHKQSVFFLALHPAVSSSGGENFFESELRDLVSPRYSHNVPAFLARFLPWFIHDDRSVHSFQKSLGNAYPTVSRFLTDVFVEPTRQVFEARHTDEELIRASQRDHEVFSVLYKRYRDKVFDYFFHRLFEEDQALDMTQETFLRSFQYIDRFTVSNASYLTYLLRIAHNILVNYYRDKKPQLSLDDDNVILSSPAVSASAFDNDLVWKYVESLPQLLSQVIRMKYRDGYSIHEIAGIMNRTENAVKLLLGRARKQLRMIMMKTGPARNY